MMNRFIPLLAFLIFLTGCSTILPTVNIEPQTLAQIRTITVITLPKVEHYVYWSEDRPLIFSGGGLHRENLRKQLTDAILAQGQPTVVDALAHNIAAQLRQRGFAVEVEQGHWKPVTENSHTLDFEKIDSKSDAFLVPFLSGALGFIEPECMESSTSDCPGFLPTVIVTAVLYDRDKQTILYRGFHRTGFLDKHRSGVLHSQKGWRETPHSVSFENFNALMADPKATTQALRDATSGIATTIAEDLQPQALRR
jgi:hypothetical protein